MNLENLGYTHRKDLGCWAKETPVSSTNEEINDSYRDRAISILRADQRHYHRHAEKFKSAREKTGMLNCNAWAGGHPKLETVAGFRAVNVIDYNAMMYQATSDVFIDLYGSPDILTFERSEITAQRVSLANRHNVANTFVHFLEHLTPKFGESLIDSCNGNPVLIYGPNVDKAVDENWFHFRPSDHNTFWTFAGMRDMLKRHYSTVHGEVIDEDYLFVGVNAQNHPSR